MKKDEFESALTDTSVKPVYRTRIGNEEVFIADGFIVPSQLKYLSKFGMTATPEDYPFGCFATIWYVEKKIGLCGIVICEAFHDPGHSPDAKSDMRIQTAVSLARQDLDRIRKMN